MNNILESFVAIAPYINDLTINDTTVSICDLEKCLIYVPGKKLDHKISAGTPHIDGAVSYQCILDKRKIVKRVEKEVFGFAYIAIGIPIFDKNKNIIGSVVFTETVDTQDKLMQTSDNLFAAMKQMVAATEIITDNTNNLKKVGKELKNVDEDSSEHVNETDQILRFISNISKKTNLLGLNASIEAARLGNDGKGFGVVANEIRKLASQTDEYVRKVDEILNKLKDSTSNINMKIEELIQISSQQVNAIDEISSYTLEINSMADSLRQLSRISNE